MFERYTNEVKRAIYSAAHASLDEGAEEISSTHLLLGLLTHPESRGNTIFRLGEILPDETGRQASLREHIAEKWELIIEEGSQRSFVKKKKTAPTTLKLSRDGKLILAYTAREANRLRDYWIDDEHLVLGILRANENAAAARLHAAGLDLETARHRVVENIGSRPTRPDPLVWWVRRRSIGFALVLVFILGIVTALILLGFGGIGIAIAIIFLAIGQLLNSMARRHSFSLFGIDDV